MTRFEAALFHLATFLVGATGIVYGIMRYLLEPADPYAVVNHPLQPAVQHWHVWTAPLLVFAVGFIWRGHFLHNLRSGKRSHRRSGIALAAGFFLMVASGYLLQTSTGETARRIWTVLHVATSLLWLAACLIHLFLGRPKDEASQCAKIRGDTV